MLRLWDVDSGDELLAFEGPPEAVLCMAIAPDGRRAVTAGGGRYTGPDRTLRLGSDYSVRLWDLKGGTELRRFPGHRGFVWGVAFTPDGRQVLSAGVDGAVRVWDAESGDELAPFRGHEGASVTAVAVSPDGRFALSGGTDQPLRLWDIATRTELHRFRGHTGLVRCLAFSPDGSQFLSGGQDATVRLWALPDQHRDSR
jgi:WD40 repeat protein